MPDSVLNLEISHMKNWKLATTNFLIGYAIASVVGYVLYLISITFMWIGMFTIMPVVFTYLSYLYFRKLIGAVRVKEAHKLALYWIGLSFLLDAAIYIALLPASFGVKPNWTFFLDQSPWIWVAYASIVLITLAGFWFYRRHKSREYAA